MRIMESIPNQSIRREGKPAQAQAGWEDSKTATFELYRTATAFSSGCPMEIE
jgi:hypothetical protein